jgi:hypothetical protein
MFGRLLSPRMAAGGALLVAAVAVAAAPSVFGRPVKQCVREETVNVFVGRVSQAQKVCVEYGDGSTDAIPSQFFGVRFSPPEPTREAPFTIVVVGLEPGERVQVVVAPPGLGLDPASVTADRAGEARVDFRVPPGGQREWVVVASRTRGERVEVAVPFAP